MKLKEYRIPMPLTPEEYHLGQQWTEIELLKETVQTCSTCVIFYDHTNERERMEIINEKVPEALQAKLTSLTPMTHRQYHIKDQKSKLFDFFFFKLKTDLILDEYSWEKWPYTLTIIENLDHCIRVVVQSDCQTASPSSTYLNSQTYFSPNNEQMKVLKDYEIINISERHDEKKDYRVDEDPTRNVSLKKPYLLPLQVNSKWYENYSRTQPLIWVRKLIELVILNEKNEEKSLLTKATNKIIWSSVLKTQRMLYHRFHQKMVSHIDQWVDRTMASIREEEKLLKKCTAQHRQETPREHLQQ